MAGGDQSFCQRPPNILSARPRKTCSGQRAATQWFFGSNSVCTKRPICRLIRVEVLPRAGELSMSERRRKRGKEKGQVLVLVTLVSIRPPWRPSFSSRRLSVEVPSPVAPLVSCARRRQLARPPSQPRPTPYFKRPPGDVPGRSRRTCARRFSAAAPYPVGNFQVFPSRKTPWLLDDPNRLARAMDALAQSLVGRRQINPARSPVL